MSVTVKLPSLPPLQFHVLHCLLSGPAASGVIRNNLRQAGWNKNKTNFQQLMRRLMATGFVEQRMIGRVATYKLTLRGTEEINNAINYYAVAVS